ncbi:MAG: L,D-transpeptidase family protein [Patescibacteria group bacterium]
MFFKKVVIFLFLFLLCFCCLGAKNDPTFPEELIWKKDVSKLILVSLDNQCLATYEYGRLVLCYPISSGRKDRPTPIGKFKIINKEKNGFSAKYKAPMPWTMAWDGLYALHAGELPGYPDSHGCVRLLLDDAKQLFSWAEIGTEVLIIGFLGELDSFLKDKAPQYGTRALR